MSPRTRPNAARAPPAAPGRGAARRSPSIGAEWSTPTTLDPVARDRDARCARCRRRTRAPARRRAAPGPRRTRRRRSPRVRRGVVRRVFVVGERPRFELAVARRARRSAQPNSRLFSSSMYSSTASLARPVVVHLAGRDLAQRGDGRLVLRVNERRGALHERAGALRRPERPGRNGCPRARGSLRR